MLLASKAKHLSTSQAKMRGYPFRSVTADGSSLPWTPTSNTVLPTRDYLRDIMCVGIIFE